MLEDLATAFVNQSEANLNALGYGLTILGGIIAGLTTRSLSEIERAPYFAYSALIFLFVSVCQLVWLQSLPAMLGGYLWVLMAISLGATVIGGFLYGRIAMARSRDAYGHGRMAALAFIPIANLWLLTAPSKVTTSANRLPAIPLLTGGLGVLSGFILLIAASTVTVLAEREAERIAARAEADPSLQKQGLDFLVRSRGLEEAMRQIAADARTPIAVDEVTVLTRIEAQGTQLRRTYVVSLRDAEMTDAFRSGSTNAICAHPPFLSLLRAGATIREVYVMTDGSPIGAILVSREDCGL